MSTPVEERYASFRIPGFAPFELAVHPAGELVSDMMVREQIWEPGETRLLSQLLVPGDVFVDAGANLGYFSVVAHELVGIRGRVLAFEPDPANFALLEQNAGSLACCTRAALGKRGDRFGGLSKNAANRGDIHLQPGAEVQVVAGDDLGLEHLHFLKVDTQGSEFRILEGFADTIGKSRDDFSLLIEFWPYGLERLGDSARALAEVLLDLDLPIYRVTEWCTELLEPAAFEHLAIHELDIEHQGFVNLLLTSREVAC